MNISADNLSVLRVYREDSGTVINSDTDGDFNLPFYFRNGNSAQLVVTRSAIRFAPSSSGVGYIGSYSSTNNPRPVEDKANCGMSLMKTANTDFDIVNKRTSAINVVVVCSAGIKSYTIQANSEQNISGLKAYSMLLVLWSRSTI